MTDRTPQQERIFGEGSGPIAPEAKNLVRTTAGLRPFAPSFDELMGPASLGPTESLGWQSPLQPSYGRRRPELDVAHISPAAEIPGGKG